MRVLNLHMFLSHSIELSDDLDALKKTFVLPRPSYLLWEKDLAFKAPFFYWAAELQLKNKSGTNDDRISQPSSFARVAHINIFI